MDGPTRRFRWIAVLSAPFAMLFVSGCTDAPALREIVLQAAQLEESLNADHAGLREELAQVEAEGGTPLRVARQLPPADQNVATALSGIIDVKLLSGILNRSTRLFPQGKFQFTPLEFAEMQRFRQRNKHRQDKVYDALQRPDCVFPIDYRLGFFYEAGFIDEVTVAFRLMAFEVGELLQADDVASTLRPLDAMWRLTGFLSKERFLSSRIRAAELRAEAILVVEAVANHRAAQRDDLAAMYRILQLQLKGWTPDSEALMGDRAMTLHAYECIRRRLIKWILTVEEKKRFRDDLSLDSLPDVVSETIDDDQAFYLDAMRQHLDLCQQPFYQRLPKLIKLEEQLDQTRMSAGPSNYPILAGMLFLPDLGEAHELLARDRARCEALSLGLALACGEDPPGYEINPHHGLPYEIERESQRVVVRLNEADERDVAIVIPIP